MIASETFPRQPSKIATTVTVSLVVCVSLVAAALAVELGWLSIGVIAAVAVICLTLWQPRIGFYLAVVLTFVFEAKWRGPDPLTSIGWMVQVDVSSWSPISAIKFSPLEMLIILVALSLLWHALVQRRGLRPMQLAWPALLFTGVMAASVVLGIATGGDYKVSLFETRALFLAMFVAWLVPSLLPKPEHAYRVMGLLVVSIVLLSMDVIWRRFVALHGITYLDDQYAHETPVLMNVVIVYLLARFLWPSSSRDRWLALLIPLIVVAEAVTERRAGWLVLDVGLIFLCVAVFQLRRKLFLWVVLPLGIVYLGYMGAFWNGNPSSTLAQPARAVRSIVSPDPRDAASNGYRVIETQNIRLNIHAHPITGLGFGHEFTFYLPLPDLGSNWPFFRYTPHNSFLWLWLKMGPAGFGLFLILVGGASVRGVQLLKRAPADGSVPVLIALVSGLLMLTVYTYVDVALTTPRTALLLGLAVGIIGTWGRQLAASRGAHVG